MIGLVVSSYLADQGGPLDWAKEFLVNQNCLLESLTALNKSAAAIYIQMFDSPRKLAVPITSTSAAANTFTAVAHGFITGDAVRIPSGITGLTNVVKYLGRVDADTFKLYGNRANALSGTTPFDVTVNSETATLDLDSNYTSAPIPEEYPLLAAAGAPSNLISYVNGRFKRGLYVRAVTAVNGSTLIGSADVKFTPRYRIGDLGGLVSYED
jgi:hypothetical protein